MDTVNTLLIGAGYHAKRIYLPFMKENSSCNLVACFDLYSQKENIENFLKTKNINVPCYFTEDYSISDQLGQADISHLGEIIKKHKVEAVIISTEPLAHFKYAKWALNNNLHILLDKPITTEIDAATNVNKARKIYQDYKILKKLYIKKSKKKNIIFKLQSQRRFHIGFKSVRQKIQEMAQLSGCPVTFIQSFHADGQWTFPNEFITQTYHPYNQGYGKMSHSGYHSLDIAVWFAMSSLLFDEKKWESYSLYAQFVRPSDVFAQFHKKDYFKIFPNITSADWNFNEEKELKNITGEVDSLTSMSFFNKGNIITNISCSCLHNSFSRRGWFNSIGRDLYKGNGRVRQESYIIEQGPFQSIIINSFQAEEIQKTDLQPYGVGGEYHFDIHIFRNTTLFPQLKTYEHLTMQSLNPVEDQGYSRGHQEDARRGCLLDFYKSIISKESPRRQGSNILDHDLTVKILSSIYVSAAKQFAGQHGLVKNKINLVDL